MKKTNLKKKSIKLKVYYYDTDKMGVVYHSNYLKWMEIARTEYFRDVFPYKSMEELGFILPVKTLNINYIDSAKYDLGSTFTLSIITAVVLGGTLSTGGKGSILGTVLASLMICIMRYGLPLCFGIKTQSLDLPIGIMLLIVVIGRELSKNKLILQLFKRGK